MIDLRIGNPDLFFEMLSICSDNTLIPLMTGMSYHKEGPLTQTIEAIKKLHEKFHPGLLTSKSQIVVGSGAGQLINAFFYLNPKSSVQSPFWFRIPMLVKKQKAEAEYKISSEGVNLITYPSNPDGKMLLGNENTWYDCVYLWPWFFSNEKDYVFATNTLSNTKKAAAIFSLSKMTGHCGTRFGWAIINNKENQKNINEYMEFESGGLGYDTQIKAIEIINSLLEKEIWHKQLLKINQKLTERKKQFYFFSNKNNWFYEEKPGMFAWVMTQKNALKEFEKIGIKGTCGSTCGGTVQQIRLNLAVSDATWNEVVKLFL